MKQDFKKRYGTGIILCAAGIIGLIAACCMNQVWQNRLDKLADQQVVESNEQAAEQNREEISAQSEADAEEEEVRQEVTGMETSRKETDDAIMADIMSYAVTWSSQETYDESRNNLIEAYPWIENTSFMTMFFPSSDTVILTDSSGEVVSNPLDDGRNITFVSMESHVVDIQDGTYSYIAEVTTQSVWESGSSTGVILITYDMTEDGQAENLNAYTVAY